MNIKKLLAAFLVMLIWIAFVYGCIAFFYMQANPKLWPWDGIFFMVGFGFVIGAIFTAGAYFNVK